MRRIPFSLLAAIACFLAATGNLAAQLGLSRPGEAKTPGKSVPASPPGSTTNQTDKVLTNLPPANPSLIKRPATVPTSYTHDTTRGNIELPPSVPDPIEPANRVMWTFNKGVMIGIVQPTSKAYRFVVIRPVRTGIGNFGRNLTYPDRLINNLLQGRWAGARHETDRFFCNTVVGVGGLIDVASRWNIPKSDADFGQTFGKWGWKPQVYLMLPIYGPSNDRDAVGLIGDNLANPLLYFPPLSYVTMGITYNNLTDSVDEYVRFADAEMDPYAMLQYAWTFVRKNQVANFQVKGEQDESSLETLQSVFFTYKDPEFPTQGKTRSVFIPTTGKNLKFTYWLQPGKAPVVYIVPGLGSHRLAETSIALAELVYKHGFTAVCVSSVYHSEFMEHASTAAVPAYTPVDTHDLHVALTEIDHWLTGAYNGRLGSRALMGYSMGGFHTMFVAATETTNQSPLIKFDRYVGINTPARLLYGVSKLDEFYQAPLEWPAAERTADIQNTFLKVAALGSTSLRPQTTLPFSAVESKFLIGLTFRFILRDVIFSSQQRYNQGVLKRPIKNLRREPVYQEIMEYSYKDYFEDFVIPYYKTRGIDLTVPATLAKAGDLRTYGPALHSNPKIRLVINRNDFLIADEDFDWMRATFDPKFMTVFEQGGHLGNLSHPAVQKAILGALEDLRPARGESK
ncbi:MlaA family lipoprotein [Pedosphaera parvula]|uniref:VacJ family lipoprotein n=1 Tax=Pedosphaera parvula (strain Ellin514) TaxID=320771 RepID=B9XHY5_PEDPL|nr:VacJ family lipoprotein [Pedosphaera parvula]EEF60478.1 VacJ family lipoprotein [Pedosphaera parvula Ellin514]